MPSVTGARPGEEAKVRDPITRQPSEARLPWSWIGSLLKGSLLEPKWWWKFVYCFSHPISYLPMSHQRGHPRTTGGLTPSETKGNPRRHDGESSISGCLYLPFLLSFPYLSLHPPPIHTPPWALLTEAVPTVALGEVEPIELNL